MKSGRITVGLFLLYKRMVMIMAEISGMSIGIKLDTVQVEKGLTGLKRELKTANAEFKNNLSAFDYGEKSIGKYESKLDGLNKKLEVQQRVTEESRKKYEDMSEQHGEGSKQAQEAERQYNDQSAALNNLNRYIENTESELKELQEQQRIASSNWTKMGDTLETTGSRMQSVGKTVGGLGKAWTKGVTLPIIGLGTAAVGAAKKTADHADEVLNASKKVGTSTDSYQELTYALKQMGLEESQTDRALGRLNQRMGKAADGNEKYRDGLKAVGISQKDLEEGTYDTDEAFIKIIDSLQDVEDSQERSSKASEIFGTNMSRQLLPAINGGSKELEELRKQAHDAGAVMSGDALKDSQEFKLAMDDLQERGKGLVHELGAKLAPVLTDKLIPAVEDKGIPMLEKMADSTVDLVDWYTELDDGTKKLVNRLGTFAVAGGPVLSVTGKMTSGVGGLAKGAGSLSKSLGKAGGSGAVGALSGLSKGGAAGLAIAGVGALSVGMYRLYKDSKKAKDANLDLAESLSDKANKLENSADTFDRLSEKAKLSNDQLAELNDLNKEISDSSNPGEVDELQKRYDLLAEKSGLSKDELKNLFKANDDIIEQSPDVEKTISDQGNKWVDNTDAVEEYIKSMRDASMEEIEGQLGAAMENRNDALSDIKEKEQEIGNLKKELTTYTNAHELSEQEVSNRIDEINQKLRHGNQNSEKKNELSKELTALLDIQNGDYADGVDRIQEQINKKRNSIETSEEEIEKEKEIRKQASDILLSQIGINKEGDKGLETLDKNIQGNYKEIEKLEDKKKKHGELSAKQQENLDKTREEVKEQENTRKKIFKKTGLYNNLNNLTDAQIEKSGQETQKKIESLAKTTDIKVEEGDILKQLNSKNGSLDDQIQKLETSKKKEGANKKQIQGQIDSLKDKKVKNNNVKEQILKELGLWSDLDSNIKDTIRSTGEKGSKIKENNSATKRGIDLEIKRTDEAGKDVEKTVTVTPSYMPDALNDDLETQAKKMLKIGVNPIGSSFDIPMLTSSHAQGTNSKGHPGGIAQVNDGVGSNSGKELIQTPSGNTGMFKGTNVMANLPKGTHVWSAKETKNILGGTPQYAKGTNNPQMDFTMKGVKEKAMTMLKAAKVASTAMTGVTPKMLPILANNLTTNLDDVASAVDTTSAPSGKGVTRWRPQVKKALEKNNLSTSEGIVNKVLKQIKTESGGNPKAVQGSDVWDINMAQGNPARGLMQTIPSTFMANKHPGHGNIMNGYDNLLAALRYAKGRYGSNLSALGQGHGYKQGTNFVPEDQPAFLHKGESVIPKEYNKKPTDAMKLLAVVGKRIKESREKEVHVTDERNNELVNLMKQFIEKADKMNGIEQNITITSPETSPSENARKLKKASRQLAKSFQ